MSPGKIREMIDLETFPGDEADEVTLDAEDEYAFVLGYLGSVRTVAQRCAVSVMPPRGTDLTDLVEPALEIARTVGCSPYIDDFQPPEVDPAAEHVVWTTADGYIYDTRTPPQS